MKILLEDYAVLPEDEEVVITPMKRILFDDPKLQRTDHHDGALLEQRFLKKFAIETFGYLADMVGGVDSMNRLAVGSGGAMKELTMGKCLVFLFYFVRGIQCGCVWRILSRFLC